MKRYCNSKGRFSSIILLISLSVVSVLIYNLALGYYQAKYTESAHGSASYGVNRTGLKTPIDFGYSKGNCAHCHEKHASIGGQEPSPTGGPDKFELFAPMNPTSQTTNFCFQCHMGAGSVQVGGITNYTYSKNFGGGTANYFTNIYDAFNTVTGSSHNLADVLTHALKWTGYLYTTNTNACIVCHDPHTAQRNYPVTVNAMGGVNTAVRRPADYTTTNKYNLWGDETTATSGFNELMSEWVGAQVYQAPYYVGKTTYEPANNATANGSNLPNFVVSCRQGCHRGTATYSTERARNLYPINWTNDTTEPGTRSPHGMYPTNKSSGMGQVIAPYSETGGNYVLSCTDCHEPHGSQNKWLLRTTANGKDNISGVTADCWYPLCTACHVLTSGTDSYHAPDKCCSPAPCCTACHKHNGMGEQSL